MKASGRDKSLHTEKLQLGMFQTRQRVSNQYAGVAAIEKSSIRRRKPSYGLQWRDEQRKWGFLLRFTPHTGEVCLWHEAGWGISK